MSYEIPQKLKYEEKIIFGLTLRQLIYVPFFFLPAAVILLKGSMHIFIRIVIAVMLCVLGGSFMYLHLLNHIKNMFAWLKFRKADAMDAKMARLIGVEKITEGVVYVRKD